MQICCGRLLQILYALDKVVGCCYTDTEHLAEGEENFVHAISTEK